VVGKVKSKSNFAYTPTNDFSARILEVVV